jgi:arginine repressor
MEAKKRAEEQLQHALSEREYRLMQASLARALTRLKLVENN